jgi:hypothetical protein
VNLLAALVDDAGLFPPASLSMADVLARHRADEAAGHPMLSHRFLCPASRLGELREEWARLARDDQRQLRLGVILATITDLSAARREIAQDPLLALEMFEWGSPVSAGPALIAMDTALELEGVGEAVFLEGPPRRPDWVKRVAAAGPYHGPLGAKVRCGGAERHLFPSPEDLAAFVCACFEYGVPFKATAGLHRAVRHLDEETGFVHHGFLNLVLAAVRAAAGSPVDQVAAVLASTDGPALVAEAKAVSGREVSAARLLFRSYGSCSTSEPRKEAAALGLLEV